MSWPEAKGAQMRVVYMRFPLLFTNIYRACTVCKSQNGSRVRVRDPQSGQSKMAHNSGGGDSGE